MKTNIYLSSLKASFSGQYREAGVDEVGRGCLAGPVVAAAVVLPLHFEHPVLRDSKKIANTQHQSLAEEIKGLALDWAVAMASVSEIARYNIAGASMLAMHRALAALQPAPELILVDGNRFVPFSFVPHRCIVKGDNTFFSIAAASVLAKAYRDRLMRQLHRAFPQYGWHDNVGYPTAAHRQALKNIGPSPWHRRGFKGVMEKND
ncbi:MAG: ribonuclease HII [Microscillaceae bacterium]